MTSDFHSDELVPVLPLRNSVVFPASVIPINVGRAKSVRLVEDLLSRERATVAILSQKESSVDEPTAADLYEIGTLARVVKVLRLGPSSYSVVVHGLGRFRLVGIRSTEPHMMAEIVRLESVTTSPESAAALGADLRAAMKSLVEINPTLPKETASILENVREEGTLADLIASNFGADLATVAEKQRVLETLSVEERVGHVLAVVRKQLEVDRVRKQVRTMVEDEGRAQREEILRQQMRNIRDELGEGAEDEDVEELRERVAKARMPDDVLRIARKQLARMASMQQQSGEYNVTRNYVEWLADMPWKKSSPDRLDVNITRQCLDEDHYGLEKIKKRIIEYVAVRKLRGDKKGPILCFLGPPGVGKTSLGRSIARSMDRRYHRIALGGVRDEAEIRGHRRTYVGALPGRLIQGLKKVGVNNPVLVLDEIDKLGVDSMGDPSAALLEVLDPEQNATFQDHYLDVPFDLSQVVFLATANNPDTIPGPLADRMEIIELPGYTRAEKKSIAREFLCPKQLSAHGLTDERLEFRDDGIDKIVDSYTREAGVRGLEREIGSVCRNVAMRLAEGEDVREVADSESVPRILGVPKYFPDLAERASVPGVATGLAWTPSGGDILFFEATTMPGRGEILVTGNLKSVMGESAAAAMSFVRSHAAALGLSPEFLKNIDVHLHVPKGGTPKDGPSAGITMFSALASLLLKCPVRRDVAMTGEITLRGRVMPVGGIKEKLLAAHRAGIREVLLPAKNEADLEDVPRDVRDELKIHLISNVSEILPIVLEPPNPGPAPEESLGDEASP